MSGHLSLCPSKMYWLLVMIKVTLRLWLQVQARQILTRSRRTHSRQLSSDKNRWCTGCSRSYTQTLFPSVSTPLVQLMLLRMKSKSGRRKKMKRQRFGRRIRFCRKRGRRCEVRARMATFRRSKFSICIKICERKTNWPT